MHMRVRRTIVPTAVMVTAILMVGLALLTVYGRLCRVGRPPVAREALGLRITLTRLERRSNGVLYFACEVSGLSKVSKKLRFVLQAPDFIVLERKSSGFTEGLKSLFSGKVARPAHREEIILRASDRNSRVIDRDRAVYEDSYVLHEHPGRLGVRVKVWLEEPRPETTIVFRDVPVRGRPISQKVAGLDLVLRRIYVNDFLNTGRMEEREIPNPASLKTVPVFVPGTSGERNMGVEMESLNTDSMALQTMGARLIDDLGRRYEPVPGYVFDAFVGGLGKGMERRIFRFPAVNPPPRRITLQLTYQPNAIERGSALVDFGDVRIR